jgi:nicotinamide riboside transporter PnuC
VLVAAVLVAARRGRPRDAWSLTIATAVIAVVVFLANGDALA